jgi:hypothetical protein
MRKQLLLAALISLAACSTLVPQTMRAVQAMNPLTADPADIALRLAVPDSIAIVPGSAILTLGAQNRAGEVLEQSFALEVQRDVMAVAPKDHAALRLLQTQIGAWKAADPDGTKGSLSLAFEPCRTQDTVPDDAKASVAIRLARDGPFLPLVDEAPLRSLFRGLSQKGMDFCP